jgi:hypothetical protein
MKTSLNVDIIQKNIIISRIFKFFKNFWKWLCTFKIINKILLFIFEPIFRHKKTGNISLRLNWRRNQEWQLSSTFAWNLSSVNIQNFLYLFILNLQLRKIIKVSFSSHLYIPRPYCVERVKMRHTKNSLTFKRPFYPCNLFWNTKITVHRYIVGATSRNRLVHSRQCALNFQMD